MVSSGTRAWGATLATSPEFISIINIINIINIVNQDLLSLQFLAIHHRQNLIKTAVITTGTAWTRARSRFDHLTDSADSTRLTSLTSQTRGRGISSLSDGDDSDGLGRTQTDSDGHGRTRVEIPQGHRLAPEGYRHRRGDSDELGRTRIKGRARMEGSASELMYVRIFDFESFF